VAGQSTYRCLRGLAAQGTGPSCPLSRATVFGNSGQRAYIAKTAGTHQTLNPYAELGIQSTAGGPELMGGERSAWRCRRHDRRGRPASHLLEQLGRGDVARVGGKNASLGEMVRNLDKQGVRVPPGFATTADAYWQYVEANGLRGLIADSLAALEVGHAPLAEAGTTIRRAFLRGTWPQAIAEGIRDAYQELCRRTGKRDADVAVRSSATAEDLPDASFAGQQESYLNIRGEAALLDACQRCYASLFTERSHRWSIAHSHSPKLRPPIAISKTAATSARSCSCRE
jgi:hypothetical protein